MVSGLKKENIDVSQIDPSLFRYSMLGEIECDVFVAMLAGLACFVIVKPSVQ